MSALRMRRCASARPPRARATTTSRPDQRSGGHRRRRHPPRLRIPGGECRIRRSRAEVRDPLDWPPAGTDAPHGRQGIRAQSHGGGGRSCGSGSPIIETDRQAEEAVERIGFARHHQGDGGGGGRGMKIVDDKARLFTQLASARAEAQAGFNNPAVYWSATSGGPTHRSAGSGRRLCGHCHGRARVLHPTRHQKLIEEAPRGTRPTPGASSSAHGTQGHLRHRLPHGWQLGIPARRRKALLLHRDEHAHPGRAHGHRDGLWRGPGAGADEAGRRRSDTLPPRTCGRAVTPSRFASTPRIP